MSKSKIIVFAALLVTMNSSNATNLFPRGCINTGYGFSNNYLVLNEHGGQTLYFMQNRSNINIEFEHIETQSNVFMSPKLESKLYANHWSAFASDTAYTYFRCYKRVGTENEKIAVNCQDVLSVCQYTKVKFALSNMGNYWVSTDKPLQQVIRDSTKKGIYLKW
jgi:hypothetical protein